MSSAYIPRDLRRLVTAQARSRCGYCLTQEAIVGTPMEFEHLFPRSRGGATTEENLWLACSLCNEHKGNSIAEQDPKSGVLVRLFNPRLQIWSEHFAWTEAEARIAGITPTGRATVKRLRLNRLSLVTAREIWVSAGWHPPVD